MVQTQQKVYTIEPRGSEFGFRDWWTVFRNGNAIRHFRLESEAAEWVRELRGCQMTDATRKRLSRFLPYWIGQKQGGIGFAVFNVRASDKRYARARIIKEFGAEVWKRDVRAKMRSGIMEIFNHPQTRPLKRYAWYCAMSVDRRITAQQEVR